MTAFVKCCGTYRFLEMERRGRQTFATCPVCKRRWHPVKRALARNAELRASGGTTDMRSFAESTR